MALTINSETKSLLDNNNTRYHTAPVKLCINGTRTTTEIPTGQFTFNKVQEFFKGYKVLDQFIQSLNQKGLLDDKSSGSSFQVHVMVQDTMIPQTWLVAKFSDCNVYINGTTNIPYLLVKCLTPN